MSKPQRYMVGLLWTGVLAVAAVISIHTNLYGLTLFIALPTALGAVSCWTLQPRSMGSAAGTGLWAGALAALGFFALGFEGLLCVIMSMPLVMPLGLLGACIAYSAMNKKNVTTGTAMMLILPLGLGSVGFDAAAKPHVFVVRSSIEIAAPPETVWKNVVNFSELPPPAEWYFKTGLAYPMRAHIDGNGAGATRYCEFSTGPFVEPIEVWDEPHLLRFSVAQNPAPMEEWSPYAKVVPPHLHGKLISKQGQFLLTPLPNGHTLLEGTTWYQHGLWPEMYWTIWSQAIIHRIHMRVLVHIKNLSEGKADAGERPAHLDLQGVEMETVGVSR